MTEPLWKRILPFADGTRTRIEIAKILDCSPNALYSAVISATEQHGVEFSFKSGRSYRADLRWLRLLPYFTGEFTRQEIASNLKLTLKQVDSSVRIARKNGYNPQFKTVRQPRHVLERDLDRGYLRYGGGIGQLVRSMPDEIALWLAGQVPEGGTVSDVIRGIVIDAYYEEKDATQD